MSTKSVFHPFMYKTTMTPVKYFLFVLGVLVVLSSCEEEETIHLDTELELYFERFASEAANYDIDFDYQTDRVEGYLTQVEEQNVSGKCERNSVYPNRVYIDIDFWRRANDLNREYVVFHELGHCFLDRGHLDDSNAAGVCLSMMQSGEGNCKDTYSQLTRSVYLEELFTYER